MLVNLSANLPQSILVMVAIGRLPIDVVLVQLILFELSEGWTFEHETWKREKMKNMKLSIGIGMESSFG